MVNYPNKKPQKKTISYRNRGMTLEDDINTTNEYYLLHNIAVIHKKPIPVKVVDVSYPNRQTAMITKAFYVVPSTTDYNGLWDGKYVDFEAKETSSATSFPLQNIHPHQIEHLLKVKEHGGISFILVRFTKLDELFLLQAKDLKTFVERSHAGGRKSIHIDEFRQVAHKIDMGYAPRIDYIEVLKNL